MKYWLAAAMFLGASNVFAYDYVIPPSYVYVPAPVMVQPTPVMPVQVMVNQTQYYTVTVPVPVVVTQQVVQPVYPMWTYPYVPTQVVYPPRKCCLDIFRY